MDQHEKDILRIKTKLEKKFNLVLVYSKSFRKGNYNHYIFYSKICPYHRINYCELFYDKRYNHTTKYVYGGDYHEH